MRSSLLAMLLFSIGLSAQADPEPVRVHLIFIDNSSSPITEVMGATFRIDNLPLGQCTLTEHWNTPLVIGDVVNDLDLAFGPPLTGPLFYFGYIELTAFESVPADHIFSVGPAGYNGRLTVGDADIWDMVDVLGGTHIFNCIGTCDWSCYGGPVAMIGLWADLEAQICHQDIVSPTPTRGSSFSLVKTLY